MPQRTQDRRVKRTRSAIVGSFNRLVTRRPYGSIQIADIVDGAGIGRSTLYEHFRNKDDILRHSVSGLMNILAGAVDEHDAAERIRCVLEHIREHRAVSRPLLAGDSAPHVARQLADLIEARLAATRRVTGCRFVIPIRLVAAQAADAQLGLIRAWLDALSPCSALALAEAMCSSTRAAVESLRNAAR